MAIKVRCEECRKKVSVDDAFIGGVCRCPYCSALIHVEGKSPKAGGRSRRPSGPSLRPDAPSGQEAHRAHIHIDEEHIPTAAPVQFQGILTLVLIVVLLLMVVGGIVMGLRMMKKPAKPVPQAPTDTPRRSDDEKDMANPFVENKGPSIVGVKIGGDIIYCLDAGSGMRDSFDYAVMMMRYSVMSLNSDQDFNVMLCDNSKRGYQFLLKDYIAGGPKGQRTIARKFKGRYCTGATNIARALKAALKKKPNTIILFARKPVDKAIVVAEQARKQGVKIVTMGMDTMGDDETVNSMAKLSEITGAESKIFTDSQLREWIGEAPALK